MKKINSYSKYQREIIKKIAKELGASIAFSYGRCSNNHLKVYIDGLDKPFYTSSTPSDRKAGDNFIGGIRSALKAENLKQQPVTTAVKHMNNALLKKQYFENLKSTCIKTVRTNIEQYTEKERLLIYRENSVGSLKPQRRKLAARIFENAQKVHRNTQYITGKDSQAIKGEIIKHLNYMLPTSAEYSQNLKPDDSVKILSRAVNVLSGNAAILETEAVSEGKKNQTKKDNMLSDVVMINQHTSTKKKNMNIYAAKKINNPQSEGGRNPAELLAAMSKQQAVQNFRFLNRHEGEAMLAYIALAMEQNHQQNLSEISELMEEKDINLEMMTEFLNSSKRLAS